MVSEQNMTLHFPRSAGMCTSTKKPIPSVGDSLSVLALGDCNTCGISVPPIGNTILDKFCRCLEQAGYPAHGQNLGYGMATSREGVALAKARARFADILLLNFGLVDAWVTSIPQVYVPYFPDSRSKKLVRKALKYTKRHLRTPLLRRIVPCGNVVPLTEYRTNMQEIIEVVRRLNPAVWVMLWGSPPVQNDSQRNTDLLRYNSELHDLANSMGASYLPTKPIIDNLSTSRAFLDKVHLNEPASAAIAAGMAHSYLSQLQRTAA